MSLVYGVLSPASRRIIAEGLDLEGASALAETSGGQLAARCGGCGSHEPLDGTLLPYHGRMVLSLRGGGIKTVRCTWSGRMQS